MSGMLPNLDEVLKVKSANPELMGELLDMLRDRKGWFEFMYQNCKEYIRNNGTKTTTPEEITDYLMKIGFAKLPMDIREKFTKSFNIWVALNTPTPTNTDNQVS